MAMTPHTGCTLMLIQPTTGRLPTNRLPSCQNSGSRNQLCLAAPNPAGPTVLASLVELQDSCVAACLQAQPPAEHLCLSVKCQLASYTTPAVAPAQRATKGHTPLTSLPWPV